MLRETLNKILLLVVLSFFVLPLSAQNEAYNAYTPYSMFGIGEISKQGTSYNKTMGGVGLATRDKRNINILNPAAVTAREEKSFMADFGLAQGNRYYAQHDMRSSNNTFNVYDFVISFPVYKSLAMYAGVTPYSDVGYDVTSKLTDPSIIANTGVITNSVKGYGGMTNLFVGAGVDVLKGLSVGVEGQYYFGNIHKTNKFTMTNSSYRSLSSGLNLDLSALKGGDKWTAEINYIRSDWGSSGMDKIPGFASVGNAVFSASAAQSLRAGFAIVPNRNDIRYYRKRITYRAGAYWDQASCKLDGNVINAVGVTFGATLPVFTWSNGLTLGVDFGQRGSLKGNMVRERYVNFNIGINIFDIWFLKPKYN